MSDHRFTYLTRNEDCLRALDQALAERPTLRYVEPTFAAGFVAGWQERGIAELGTVNITREHYADLERRAELGSRP